MGQLSGVVEEVSSSREGQPAAVGEVVPESLQVRCADIFRRTAMRRRGGRVQ